MKFWSKNTKIVYFLIKHTSIIYFFYYYSFLIYKKRFSVCTWITFERALDLLFSGRSLPGHLLQSQLTRSAQLETEELPEQPRLSETHHEQHQQPAHQTQGYPHARVSDEVLQQKPRLSHLIERVLKFPVSKSSIWFSERAKPKPTARNIRVRVIIRVRTNPTDHISNLQTQHRHVCCYTEMLWSTLPSKETRYVFERSLFCSPKLHSFVQNAVKTVILWNITIKNNCSLFEYCKM